MAVKPALVISWLVVDTEYVCRNRQALHQLGPSIFMIALPILNTTFHKDLYINLYIYMPTWDTFIENLSHVWSDPRVAISLLLRMGVQILSLDGIWCGLTPNEFQVGPVCGSTAVIVSIRVLADGWLARNEVGGIQQSFANSDDLVLATGNGHRLTYLCADFAYITYGKR